MFEPALDEAGEAAIPGGHPNWASVVVGSLEISRSRSAQRSQLKCPFSPTSGTGGTGGGGSDTGEGVTATAAALELRANETCAQTSQLRGLIPAALMERYQFWRCAAAVFVGYPICDTGADSRSAVWVLLHRRGDQQTGPVSASIRRVLYAYATDGVTLDGSNVVEERTLLNVKAARHTVGAVF